MNTDLLRESLRVHADDAPEGAGLLDAVHTRSRHRHRRRITVAAVAAVSLVLVGPTLVWKITTSNGPAQPAQRAVQPARPASPTLVPPEYDAPPDFPFTPGWTPPGLSEPHYFNVGDAGPGGHPKLSNLALIHYVPDSTSVGVMVVVQQDDTEDELNKLKLTHPDAEIEEKTVSAQGRDAVLLTITGTTDRDEDLPPQSVQLAVLSWRHRDDMWVTVKGFDSAEDALRYANALTEDPFPAQTPLVFDLVPDDAQFAVDESSAGFASTDVPYAGGQGGAIKVDLRQVAPGTDFGCRVGDDSGVFRYLEVCPGPREQVRVGGLDGELVEDGTLLVFLDDGRMLNIVSLGTFELSREDLIRFAAGIQVTPDARPHV